jgi:hypothetical protein
VKQKYVTTISLLKDVIFEETHDNSMKTESESNGNSYVVDQPSNGGAPTGASGGGSGDMN